MGLNILAALALLLAYLAAFINPAKFLWPALFGLAYPYILLVNLLFLFYYIIRLKPTLLISLLVILLGWNNLMNLVPIHLEKDTPPESLSSDAFLKVLSYNVRSFNIYKHSKAIDAREEIFRFLSKEDADIICLQEYFTTPNPGHREEDLDRTLTATPYKSVYYGYIRPNRSAWGIATYSKYPIIKRSRIPFSNTTNVAMYTDIKILDDTIRIFNLHLQSIKLRERNYDFMGDLKLKYTDEQMEGFRDIGAHLKQAFILRAEQANVIANYITQSPYPVILMGDFNDTPVSYAYRKIKKGLHDAFRESGRGFGNTYAGELPSFRIDYILYSDPFRSHDFKRTKIKSSDHYPVRTYLYLNDSSDL